MIAEPHGLPARLSCEVDANASSQHAEPTLHYVRHSPGLRALLLDEGFDNTRSPRYSEVVPFMNAHVRNRVIVSTGCAALLARSDARPAP